MRCFYYGLVVLFLSCAQTDTTIKLKGSDTEVNLAVQLAESFHKNNAGVFVSISGGGSGLGIASLLNGTGDIANSSRSINEEEIKLFGSKKILLDSFVFAQDAIAFIVSDKIPIDSISINDLEKILSGGYDNWQALAGINTPVTIYGRQSNSGTHEYVKLKLGISFSPYAKQMNGNAQILEAIKEDATGIGYVGAGYVIHGGANGVKVLSIYTDENSKAVSPLDAAIIASGNYYFQRPLFQYFKTGSYEKIKAFLDFEKSEEGQKIIQSAGYYPAK
jgi:phosphate transport system substrate-binding protein